MSRGYGGSARMVMQDAETIVYEYAAYNLNDSRYRNEGRVYDGLITVSRAALVEPELHEKIKKLPGGRKQLIVKRIPREVDYRACFDTGRIAVQNSKFCWSIHSGGVGMIAMFLLFKIFDRYQKDGMLPETVSYFV